MIKKNALFVILLAAIAIVVISCTSSVGVEEFSTHQQQTKESINLLKGEIDEAKKENASLNTAFKRLQNEKNILQQELRVLQEQFTKLDSDLDELVILAGYDSSDDFIDLARDIVLINKNVNTINKKIELLKEAMAVFVNN